MCDPLFDETFVDFLSEILSGENQSKRLKIDLSFTDLTENLEELKEILNNPPPTVHLGSLFSHLSLYYKSDYFKKSLIEQCANYYNNSQFHFNKDRLNFNILSVFLKVFGNEFIKKTISFFLSVENIEMFLSSLNCLEMIDVNYLLNACLGSTEMQISMIPNSILIEQFSFKTLLILSYAKPPINLKDSFVYILFLFKFYRLCEDNVQNLKDINAVVISLYKNADKTVKDQILNELQLEINKDANLSTKTALKQLQIYLVEKKPLFMQPNSFIPVPQVIKNFLLGLRRLRRDNGLGHIDPFVLEEMITLDLDPL